ncbi:acyl-CoA synthetase [Alteromonas pelagimontana]|uniref:Acyl-CoA synthetase n=1 Tax=Alteromonas pelagimontana TaxID=1858656 RepID=A0A6M4MCX9_9ALTE|nr:AMP-binding protein [Alteromonas pelagimontana]QJR80939.1 acyl-CoA synthetase [Alteromonas pelagimontana]
MINTFPLVTRRPDEAIAFLTKPVAGLSAGKICTCTFLSHVERVASSLEKGEYAINLCENRYLFLVSFCAAILRSQTNLLPPNKNLATQEQLLQEYSNCYIIHDGCDTATSAKSVNLLTSNFDPAKEVDFDIPDIADDHLACISFTSGSTGRSKPNLKYWKTLHRSTAINYEFMIPPTDDTVYQLATMPAQHMWGLETSALMPLFKNVCMSDAKPLFPQDIVDTLGALPEPRCLVSTPVHLRALSATTEVPIPCHVVLCATSPLTSELACEIEQQFIAPLHEVYGCSEAGSMAVRRTATEKHWRRFDGIHFHIEGTTTTVTADHLPSSTVLQDFIKRIDDNHFTLAGRATDLIKIAGKRGSLFEINQTLLRFEGLKDGIVIFPESNSTIPRLCAIVALKPGVQKSSLIHYLKVHLDSAFVPRPVYVVDSLPRESNGKLLKIKIDDLYASLKRKR